MYRKSIRTIAIECKRKRCSAMRTAKVRKRMERGSTLVDCGGFTTDGILGTHSVRIQSYGEGVRHYAITVDGQARQARTERGILRCITKMICARVNP